MRSELVSQKEKIQELENSRKDRHIYFSNRLIKELKAEDWKPVMVDGDIEEVDFENFDVEKLVVRAGGDGAPSTVATFEYTYDHSTRASRYKLVESFVEGD